MGEDRRCGGDCGSVRPSSRPSSSKQEYTPNSAVAFIIKGSATRTAAAFESNSLDSAFLHVDYVPHKTAQEFVTCAAPADTADPVKAAAFCQGTVQNTVSHLAQQCRLANALHVQAEGRGCVPVLGGVQAAAGHHVTMRPKAAPTDCDPSGLAVATHAEGDTPVCVADLSARVTADRAPERLRPGRAEQQRDRASPRRGRQPPAHGQQHRARPGAVRRHAVSGRFV